MRAGLRLCFRKLVSQAPSCCWKRLFLDEHAFVLVAVAIYDQAAVFKEVDEVRMDYKIYRRDPWNVLDVAALLLWGGGFVTRLVKNDEIWGQYLYALSAPALFARLLFYGQILPNQGPMIQVGVVAKRPVSMHGNGNRHNIRWIGVGLQRRS